MRTRELLKRASATLIQGLEVAASKHALRIYVTIAPAIIAVMGLSVPMEVRQLWVAAMLTGAVPLGLAAHFVER